MSHEQAGIVVPTANVGLQFQPFKNFPAPAKSRIGLSTQPLQQRRYGYPPRRRYNMDLLLQFQLLDLLRKEA